MSYVVLATFGASLVCGCRRRRGRYRRAVVVDVAVVVVTLVWGETHLARLLLLTTRVVPVPILSRAVTS